MIFNLANLYDTGFKDPNKAEAQYLLACKKKYRGALQIGITYESKLKDFKKRLPIIPWLPRRAMAMP
jgi:hypothetical protein